MPTSPYARAIPTVGAILNADAAPAIKSCRLFEMPFFVTIFMYAPVPIYYFTLSLKVKIKPILQERMCLCKEISQTVILDTTYLRPFARRLIISRQIKGRTK